MAENETEPQTVQEILASADKLKWIQAMKTEYNSLIKSKVWKVVYKPKDKKIIQSKLIYKLKNDNDGSKRYKARLVARAFSQSYGVNYFEAFSPVARIQSLRMLIALAAQYDLKIHNFDVTIAFLHGKLKGTVYMSQPEYFIKEGDENKVCILDKAVYDLKQSSRAWNKAVNEVLEEINYQRSKIELCIFFKHIGKIIIIIILYVDDFYVFHNNEFEKNKIIQRIANEV